MILTSGDTIPTAGWHETWPETISTYVGIGIATVEVSEFDLGLVEVGIAVVAGA